MGLTGIRIRRRPRLNLRLGGRPTRKAQADAACGFRYEQETCRSDPASYFTLLSDDDDDGFSEFDDLSFYYDVWRRGPTALSVCRRGRIQVDVGCSYDEIVEILAGPAFLECLERAAVSRAQFSYDNQKDHLGEFRSAPVPKPVAQRSNNGASDDVSTFAKEEEEEEEEEEDEEEQGTSRKQEQDPGEEISDQEYLGYMAQLPVPYADRTLRLDSIQKAEMYKRHALYRIRACKLLSGKPIYHPEYTIEEERLAEKGYFMCYERDRSFGWFFHPKFCELAALDDYQRLALLDPGFDEYLDYSGYLLFYHTHEIDREYLLYYETISDKLKWLEDYIPLERTCREEWFKMRNRAARQAMKIAVEFTNISVGLVRLAFMEYVSNICYDFHTYKELDGIYFEIWKRLTKQQEMSFRDALKEVYELKQFPLHQDLMKYVLDHSCSYWELRYRHCMADISGQVEEDRALELIAKTIKKKYKKPKGYEKYAAKKLKIAEILGLIPKTGSYR